MIAHQGFQNAIILSGASPALIETDSTLDQQITLEQLREARFGSFERLLVLCLFLALAKAGCVFPLFDINIEVPAEPAS